MIAGDIFTRVDVTFFFSRETICLVRFCLISSRLELMSNLFNFHNGMCIASHEKNRLVYAVHETNVVCCVGSVQIQIEI